MARLSTDTATEYHKLTSLDMFWLLGPAYLKGDTDRPQAPAAPGGRRRDHSNRAVQDSVVTRTPAAGPAATPPSWSRVRVATHSG